MSTPDAEAVLVSLARSIDKYFRFVESPAMQPAGGSVPGEQPRDAPPSGPAGTSSKREPSTTAQDPPERSSRSPLVVDRPTNLGFDGATRNGVPAGWFNSFGYVTGVSTEYTIGVTHRSEDRTVGMCVVMNKAKAAADEFGSLMQRCPGRFLAGRIIRLEGELRTENVTEGVGLWLRADGDDRPNLVFDNMWDKRIRGTTPWARYSIEALLPSGIDWLNYGILLSGSGLVSADNLRLFVLTPDGRWEDA
jgi:hypothetical protein